MPMRKVRGRSFRSASPWLCRRAVAALAVLLTGAVSAWAYTQSGASLVFANNIPMGHEWVTRMAAIELMGHSPVTAPDLPDPNDPRKTWTQGLAKNTDLSSPGAQEELKRIKKDVYDDARYASRYKAVYDAIIGERWVDLAGYNGATERDCWDAVAQEAVEIQYDHFMRRYDDRNAQGGVTTARQSQQRFVQYFVAAALARQDQMSVYDGGFLGSTPVQVSRNYFLFGRAVHLFEDSFSSEHTVRIKDDNYTRIRQVKSYLCAPGSEQHTHAISAVVDYSSGDVIWKPHTGLDPSWAGYKASNMKNGASNPVQGAALVTTEAMKDLWAAFIRAMGTPYPQRSLAASREAQTLVKNWLSFDEKEMLGWYATEANRDPTYVLAEGQTGKGNTVKACMASLDLGTDDQLTYAKQLAATQRKCLYNAVPWAGFQDLFDTQIHIWYSWKWRNGTTGPLLDPPTDWKIPDLPADTGALVHIKSASNQHFMSAQDGVSNNAWVYCKSGPAPLDFIQVGPKDNATFRVASSPWLFLSYTAGTGAVKLFNPFYPYLTDPTNYKIESRGPGGRVSIMSVYWQQFMWLKGQSPYINSDGNPLRSDGQWIIEPLAPLR
jgi:hypothetical protein